MIIVNGSIFGEDSRFHHGSVDIRGDVIADINYDGVPQQQNDEIIDADGAYVIPGLVDIHLHGAAGCDFCDGTEDAFRTIVDFELNCGVTSIVPATMTLPRERLVPIMEAIARYAEKNDAIKGITMEGPFISAKKRGAQNERFIQEPNIEFFNGLQKAARGLICQVTAAPEVTGAIDFIKKVSKECVVSVAHTNATYAEAMEAFAAGANHVTHLFNAMPPFGHRETGVIGAAFDDKNVFVELICDGEHVHRTMIRAAFQLFGANRICMISDSMSAAGMPEGEYFLGGQSVIRKETRAVLSDGTLAGAVSTLYDNFKKAVLEMRIPLEDAVTACTITPARSLGLERECGVLAIGHRADMVLLDRDLNIKRVIRNGRLLNGLSR